MTSLLRPFCLAALTTLSIFVGFPGGAFADGRAGWKDYAWQQIRIADCAPAGATLRCPLFHEKWDWKRDQWVDIAITIDPARGLLQLTQRLTNNSSFDDDHVCVTALIVDAEGKDILAHHQNWHSWSGGVLEDAFSYHSDALDQATAIHIGSKQCRQGATQDDALYASVLAGIQF